jgi:hypothetical protein
MFGAASAVEVALRYVLREQSHCLLNDFTVKEELKIMIERRSGIEKKMELAETIVSIRKDRDFETIVGKDEKTHWDEVRKKIEERRAQIHS